MPARSVSTFQWASVPDDRLPPEPGRHRGSRPGASSALSQSRACCRSFAFASSSGAGRPCPGRNRPGGGAGGVVAVRCSRVVAELRVGRQGLGPEPGGGGVAPCRSTAGRRPGPRRRPWACRRLQHGRESGGQRDRPFRLADPLGRGVSPAGPLGAQLVAAAQFGQGLGVLALPRAEARGCSGPRRWSGLSRIASRYSAMASSSFPWRCRALPRLLWASA